MYAKVIPTKEFFFFKPPVGLITKVKQRNWDLVGASCTAHLNLWRTVPSCHFQRHFQLYSTLKTCEILVYKSAWTTTELFKCFQINKEIESFDYEYFKSCKNIHFEYPYPALFFLIDLLKPLLRNHETFRSVQNISKLYLNGEQTH